MTRVQLGFETQSGAIYTPFMQLPFRPVGGDVFELLDFIGDHDRDGNVISEQELNYLDIRVWTVDYVTWKKDEDGIYLSAWLKGEL